MIRITILALLLFTGCASSPPSNISNVCSIFREKGGWHSDARDASLRWGIPISTIMAFIYQESKFDADAKPPRGKNFLWIFPGKRLSSAFGYPQAIDGTWDRYMVATDNYGADRDDFGDSVDFIGWYLRRLAKEVGIKTDDTYSLYLAYHEGGVGYRRGTHKKKPYLIKVARKVSYQARRYRRQYIRCKDEFKRFWLWRLLF